MFSGVILFSSILLTTAATSVRVERANSKQCVAYSSGEPLALGNPRFPVRVRLPVMRKVDLSAAITRLISKRL